jgi:hypothetical protein
MSSKFQYLLAAALFCAPLFCRAGNYANFSVAVYIPINVAQRFDQPQKLQADWDRIRHFQGAGFELEHGPKISDGIYTGTETRDPVVTDQHLQQYESYEIIRYFENISPGRNGGGWVDNYSLRYLDRYAEQIGDTLFAKAREFTVFEWSAMTRPFETGDRAEWEKLPTTFNFSEMTNGASAPTWARVAGYSLAKADKFLGQLGHPIGIASYRPLSGNPLRLDDAGQFYRPLRVAVESNPRDQKLRHARLPRAAGRSGASGALRV